MKNKFATARKIKDLVRKRFVTNTEYFSMVYKIYWSYIWNCIIKSKTEFSIKFGGYYNINFFTRVCDWVRYFGDCIYGVFLKIFTPKDDKTIHKYQLIHEKPSKPRHLKFAIKPNEVVFFDLLEQCGMKVDNEHVYFESTVYDVAIA